MSFLRAYRDAWLGNDIDDDFAVGGQRRFSLGSGTGSGSRGLGNNYPEWFEIPKDEVNCKEVPAVVNGGRPPGDVCLSVSALGAFRNDVINFTPPRPCSVIQTSVSLVLN